MWCILIGKNYTLTETAGVHHLAFDVSAEFLDLDTLPEILHGLVYCPGSIVLKPFQRLSIDDFLADFNLNLLGAVKVVQGCFNPAEKIPDRILHRFVQYRGGQNRDGISRIGCQRQRCR